MASEEPKKESHTNDDGAVEKENHIKDEEAVKTKLPYPKSVFFIVSNEFCERFSYYGMRTILVIYLTNILFYSEADAKIIYHTFTMFVYFFPVLGAIMSDSFLGKFNTIFYVSMIYACGSVLMALTAVDDIGIPKKPFSMVALLLMALGAGGIKPCVSAFGGDQFVLPQQELQLVTFFSLFYFSINAGSLISTFLTPILRSDVHCFGNDSCFPLAFAVPGVLMIISIVVFAAGRPLYKIKTPQGNVVVEVSKCITHAISRKIKSKEKHDHWLDYAEEKYGSQLINDIKITLHVLVLYIPLPIFWALFDQQGSGWTFQAVRMDGNIGFYTILPDQMQVVNPLLILAFIPLFTYYLYPLLAKINLLKTSLHRMICGGFLAAIAFAVSACISIAIENADPVLATSGNIQLRIYNPSPCPVNIIANDIDFNYNIDANDYSVRRGLPLSGSKEISFTFASEPCFSKNIDQVFNLNEANAYAIFIKEDGITFDLDDVAKSESGYPHVRTIEYSGTKSVKYQTNKYSLSVQEGNTSIKEIPAPGKYSILLNNEDTNLNVDFKLGGTYAVLINKDDKSSTITNKVVIVTEPNSVHILWLLPQYFIITAAEIMFSITGLEFSYSQAPLTMKSLLQACFLLTTAFGNLIIVIIESAKIFDKQSNDFFLYTGLMVIDMLIFTFMAMRYKYVNNEDTDVSEETIPEIDEDKKEKNGIDNPVFVNT